MARTVEGPLQGRAEIIMGSSSGIGEAIARRLAAAGAGVVVNSARSVEAGRAVASSLPDAVYVQGDITDASALDDLLEATRRWGKLDYLVNNAGTTVKIDIRTPWTESWDDEHAGAAAVAPLRRSGTPEEIAEVAYALLTSGYITGQVMVVDGGLGLVL